LIGSRTGLRCGVVGGSRNGSGVDELGGGASNPMAGVAQDATSGKYMPASSAQWTTTMAAAGIGSGNPSLLWLGQEASGNLADSIGAFAGTANITAYQQAVAGWAAKAFTLGAGAIANVVTTSASLPDISTTSCLMLGYVLFPASASTNLSVVTMGTTFGAQAFANLNATPKLVGGADPNTVAGTANPFGGVHPLVVQVNRGGSAAVICTEQEKLTPTLAANPAGKKLWLGGDSSQTWAAAGTGHLYTAAFFGTAAELSVAQLRTLLQTLGWSVAW